MTESAFVRKELKDLLRDRKAIFFSFLMPVLLYPVLLSFTTQLERREQQKEEEEVYDIAVTGEATLFRAALAAEAGLRLIAEPDSTRLRQEIRAGDVDAWLSAPNGVAPEGGEAPTVTLVFHGPHVRSASARDRLQDVLKRVRAEESDRRWKNAGAEVSLNLLPVVEVDVATQAEAGGARIGRLLPFLLIMTLFVGGMSLSTDIVAGEKERGTLETLYLTPTSRSKIARSKFFVVMIATLVSGVLNVASLAFCYQRGWIGDVGDPTSTAVSMAGVTVSFLLILPLSALIAGLLLAISAFARTVKEAQFYLTPVLLAAFVPGMFASSQEVHLDGFTALLPIANVALAVRDSMLGDLRWTSLVLVFASSAVWGALAMRWTTGVLSREETILGFDPEPLFGRTPGGRRRAALLGMALTTLGFFYIGQWLQVQNLKVGLVLSLWVLVPALGAATVAFAWTPGSLRELLSLRTPRRGALAGAALLAVGLVVPISKGLMWLQGEFLPIPEGSFDPIFEEFQSLPKGQLLFLIAFTPGVCEEIVFRGAFLGLLRRTGTTNAAVLISSAFFGLIHLSVFRFLPTATLGVIMAALTVRTRSIFPAMLFHMVFNGTTFLAGDSLGEGGVGVALWIGSAILLGMGWIAVARSTPSS